jgi:ATP-dependent RNA helicase RhlB
MPFMEKNSEQHNPDSEAERPVSEGPSPTEPSRRPRRRRRKKPVGLQQRTLPRDSGPSNPAAWDASRFDIPVAEGKKRFHDLHLPSEIMHAIADLGFEYCTPVQAETLPHALAGSDIIGQAQTGTGKTAAFLITILTTLLARPSREKQAPGTPRTLILAPTRELVIQISEEAQELAKHCPLHVVSIFGGIDYRKQRACMISRPVDIMVATPGRLLDFERQGAIDLKRLEIVVIDEADRMLDMGFIPDVRKIFFSAPPKEVRQTLFFSATVTPEVNRLASNWTRNAIHVEIEPEKVAVDSVEQIVYLTTAKEKYSLLYNLITGKDLRRVMVFANRRDETRKLADRLTRNGISCAVLSGDIPQKNRIETLEDFRKGKIRVLVATDVAGRGIHVDDVSHVVNYTLPFDPEDYVHRIGRTGRAGASGISVSFACEEGSFYIPGIESFLGSKLECIHPDSSLLVPVPRGAKVTGAEKKPAKRTTRPRRYGRNTHSHIAPKGP